MHKKTIPLVLALICLYSNSPAQNIKPLSVGDTVPDMVLHHLINYKDSVIRLADFKDKPVIIDFFATWCSSCIAALPHLDSLQRQFGDSIQVFVVSYESEEKIKAFIRNNKIAKKRVLAFISDDTLLKQLFPHKLIPHEVIMKDGSVKAITYPEYINIATIRAIRAARSPGIPVKKDLFEFDAGRSLLDNGNFNDKIVGRSLLTHYIPGISGQNGHVANADSNTKRIFYYNASLLYLYLLATHTPYYNNNRVILEVKDTDRYIRRKEGPDQWANKNCYCYEITLPVECSDNDAKQCMLQDLNRCLDINARLEKRKVDCWALVRINNDSALLKTKGGKREISLSGIAAIKTMRNAPLNELVIALNNQTPGQSLHPVVLDETGYKGNVDLELKVNDIQDLPATAKALRLYGLELVPAKRELEMLVITENGYEKKDAGCKPLSK